MIFGIGNVSINPFAPYS